MKFRVRYYFLTICHSVFTNVLTNSYFESYRANGLSYRANHILKYAGIPATKAVVLESLKNGSLTPTKRPIGYGKMTHAELCRWVGVTPHLFQKRKTKGRSLQTEACWPWRLFC